MLEKHCKQIPKRVEAYSNDLLVDPSSRMPIQR